MSVRVESVQVGAHARFTMSVLLVALTIGVGTLGYVIIERQPLLDCLYMTVITVFTVGFREVFPVGFAGRIWTLGVIVLGYAAVAVALGNFVSLLVGGELRSIHGRLRMKQRIEKLGNHTIICGFGRMGSLIAEELHAEHRDVVIVDRSADNLLAQDGYLYVNGDATEDDVLLEAGIMRASSLVTCLTSDADNVFVTLSARGMRPDLTIISRADQHTAETKLTRAGASFVLCPQTIGANKAAALLLRPHVVDFVDITARGVDMEIAQYEVAPDSPFVGNRLRESGIRQRAQVTVVAIKREDGAQIFDPGPDEIIRPGDQLVLLGRSGLSDRLKRI